MRAAVIIAREVKLFHVIVKSVCMLIGFAFTRYLRIHCEPKNVPLCFRHNNAAIVSRAVRAHGIYMIRMTATFSCREDDRRPAGGLYVHRDQLRAQRSVTSTGELYLSNCNCNLYLYCYAVYYVCFVF